MLHRPSLFLGGEREPALMTAIVAGGLAISGMNTVSFLVGAALWFACHSAAAVDGEGRSAHDEGLSAPASGTAVTTRRARAPSERSSRACSRSSRSATRPPGSPICSTGATWSIAASCCARTAPCSPGWFYRAPDIASSTDSERNWLSGRVNAALARLGAGWASWVDAVRLSAAGYPDAACRTSPTRFHGLVDAERRAQFLREGVHYEGEYAFVVQFTPPFRRKSKLVDLIYDDDPAETQQPGRIASSSSSRRRSPTWKMRSAMR